MNRETFRIRSLGDFYSIGMLKVIVDILIDWHFNHGTNMITRFDIHNEIKKRIKCDVNAYKMRYVNPYGEYGPTYFEKAVDLLLSNLRAAGCIKGNCYYVGDYIVTDDMYQYMYSNRDFVAEQIMKNFKKDDFDREDLPSIYVKSIQKPKAILIKKNKSGEEGHFERREIVIA